MKVRNNYPESERSLRRMRGRVFDYPPDREEQVGRVMDYLKARKLRDCERCTDSRYADVMWM